MMDTAGYKAVRKELMDLFLKYPEPRTPGDLSRIAQRLHELGEAMDAIAGSAILAKVYSDDDPNEL